MKCGAFSPHADPFSLVISVFITVYYSVTLAQAQSFSHVSDDFHFKAFASHSCADVVFMSEVLDKLFMKMPPVSLEENVWGISGLAG